MNRKHFVIAYKHKTSNNNTIYCISCVLEDNIGLGRHGSCPHFTCAEFALPYTYFNNEVYIPIITQKTCKNPSCKDKDTEYCVESDCVIYKRHQPLRQI